MRVLHQFQNYSCQLGAPVPHASTGFADRVHRATQKPLVVMTLVVLCVVAGSFSAMGSLLALGNRTNLPLMYQGRLTDASFVPITDSSRNIRFKIWDSLSGGNCVWSTGASAGAANCASANGAGTSVAVNVDGGLFSVPLGNGATNDPEILLNFNSGTFYLEVIADNENPVGTFEALSPRKQLGASPYAYTSNNVDGGYIKATGKATAVITGSIDPAASTAVVGVGTLFTTELTVGDRITVSGETRTVTVITSDTALTVDTAFSDNANDTSVDVLYAIATLKDSSGNTVLAVNESGGLTINGASTSNAAGVLVNGPLVAHPGRNFIGTQSNYGDFVLDRSVHTNVDDAGLTGYFRMIIDANALDATSAKTLTTVAGLYVQAPTIGTNLTATDLYSIRTNGNMFLFSNNISKSQIRFSNSGTDGGNKTISGLGMMARNNATEPDVAMINGTATTTNQLNIGGGNSNLQAATKIDLFTAPTTNTTTGTSRLTITGTGNVGLSTTTPVALLDVVGNVRTRGKTSATLTGSIDPIMSQTVTGVGTLFTTEIAVGDKITVSGETRTVTAISNSTTLTVDTKFNDNANDPAPTVQYAIATMRDSASAAQLVLSDTGNLGIGSTAPQSRLEVVGDVVSKGTAWTIRTSAADNTWNDINYGNGLFVAIASTGTGNRVMTSPDGMNWTSRTSAADNGWRAVTYGNGLFVAVSNTGTGNRVMTSPDGITWTSRTSAADNNWEDVTYGNGLFVAVATTGTGNRVMTSPDGITWTLRTNSVDNNWSSIIYGNGLFVAVASTGTGDRVMTSPDGVTWTTRTSAADNTWTSVAYGSGLFVAVSSTGTCTAGACRVMTSPDGITWTIRLTTELGWQHIVYGNGLFVGVASSGAGNRVETSSDGISWVTRTSAADNTWNSIAYANGVFAAVSSTGTGNRVMTSGKMDYAPFSANNTYQGGMNIFGNVGIGVTNPAGPLDVAGSASFFRKSTDDIVSSDLQLVKSRGTVTAPTIVQSGDNTGQIVMRGYDGGVSFSGLATSRVLSSVDGTPSLNNVPGRLTFETATAGSSFTTEKMRIDNAGRVGISTGAPNARLHVDGNAFAAGTGTMDSTASRTVTGTGTAFTTQLHKGDTIVAGGATTVITAIASDTSLTIAQPLTLTAATFTFAQPTVRFVDSGGATSSFSVDAGGRVQISPDGGILGAMGSLDVSTGSSAIRNRSMIIRGDPGTSDRGGIFMTNGFNNTDFTGLKISTALNTATAGRARFGLALYNTPDTFLNSGPHMELAYNGDILLAQAGTGNVGINTLVPSQKLDVNGNIQLNTIGNKLLIKEGTNASMGTCVLVGGTCTVSNTLVTANSRIFLTSQVDGGTTGYLRVSSRSAGASFVITSGSGTDTSTVAWEIIEPAP